MKNLEHLYVGKESVSDEDTRVRMRRTSGGGATWSRGQGQFLQCPWMKLGHISLGLMSCDGRGVDYDGRQSGADEKTERIKTRIETDFWGVLAIMPLLT